MGEKREKLDIEEGGEFVLYLYSYSPLGTFWALIAYTNYSYGYCVLCFFEVRVSCTKITEKEIRQ